MEQMMKRVIQGRTGEVEIVPGPWWVIDKASGSPAIVDVWRDCSSVNLFGTTYCPDIDEAAEKYEFMLPVPKPDEL